MPTFLTSIDPNLKWYLTLFVLIAALAAGAVWAYRVWSDVKGETEEPTTDPDELLAPLAEAFAAGQMSEEEYQRIKQSVGRGARSEPAPARPARPKPGPSATAADPAQPPPDAPA
jgi:hypothetical protein